jgi:hypothetical protein
MSVGAIGSGNPLLNILQANGLSSQQAQTVASDLKDSIESVAQSSGSKPDRAAVRAAVEQRLASDVSSGKLTQAQADAVTKTLDKFAAKAGDGAGGVQGAGGAGHAHGAGGKHGGGAPAKTELSSVVTVTGNIQTTTITYTDGSTETETATISGDTPTAGSSSQAATAAAGSNSAQGLGAYLSKIDPGSLLQLLA